MLLLADKEPGVSLLSETLSQSQRFANFRLLETLGQGRRGVVYKAKMSDGQEAAVKLYPIPEEDGEQLEQDLRREAILQARVQNEAVPSLIACGKDGPYFYLATELLAGEALKDRLTRGAIPFEEALTVVYGILCALSSIHYLGLVHRAVRPRYIFLEELGTVRLLDMGVTSLQHDSLASDSGEHLFRALHYISPESTGFFARPVDARSDLYSVGCLLHEMLSGAPPFRSPRPAELLRAHAHDPPPPLQNLSEQQCGLVGPILEKLLAKDPDDRYPSTREAGAAVAALIRSLGLPAPFQDMAHPSERLIPLQRDRELLGKMMPQVVGLEGEPSRFCLLTGQPGTGRSSVMRLLACQPSVRGMTMKSLTGPDSSGPLDWAELWTCLEDWTGQSSNHRFDDYGLMKQVLRHQLLEYAHEVGHLILLVDEFCSLPEALQGFLLEFCAPSLAESPVSIIATADPESGESLQRLSGPVPITKFSLGPITVEDTEALIGNFLADGELAEGLSQTFRRACGGNPGSLTQILHTLSESGGLEYRDGVWYLLPGAEASLQGAELAMRARLEMLNEQPIELLRYCCLAREDLTNDTLTEVLSISYPDASESLHNCLRQGFLLIGPERRVRPVEGLRDLLSDKLTDPRDQQRHHRLWRSLSSREPGRAEEIAWHAERSGSLTSDTQKFESFLRAGRKLAHTFDFQNAITWYKRAAVYAEEGELPELLRELGDVYRFLGRYGEASDCYQQGQTCSSDSAQTIRFLVRRARTECDNYHFPDAWKWIEEGFEVAQRPIPGNGKRSLWATLSDGLSSDKLKDTSQKLRTALSELYEAAGWVCTHLPCSNSDLNYLLESTRRELKLSSEANCQFRLLAGQAHLATALGLKAEALEAFDQSLELAHKLQDSSSVVYLESLKAQACHRLGEFRHSIPKTMALLDHRRGCNTRWMTLTLTADLTSCYLSLGRIKEASDLLEMASRRWIADDTSRNHPIQAYTAWARAAAGNQIQAEGTLRAFQEPLSDSTDEAYRVSMGLIAQLALGLEGAEPMEDLEELTVQFTQLGLSPEDSTFSQKMFYILQGHHLGARALEDRNPQPLIEHLAQLGPLDEQGCYTEHLLYFRSLLALMDGDPEFHSLVGQADNLALQNGNRWILSGLKELQSYWYHDLETEVSNELAVAALGLARRHGWVARYRRLARTFEAAAAREPAQSETDQDLQSWNERGFEALTEVGMGLTVTLDLPALARLALKNFLKALDAQQGYVLLFEDSGLELLVGLSDMGRDLSKPRDEYRGFLETALKKGEPIFDPTLAALASPLAVRGNIIGVILFQREQPQDGFGFSELRLLRVLSSVLAVNLQIAQNQSLEQKFQAESRQRDFTQRLNQFLNGVMKVRQREEALFAFYRVLIDLFSPDDSAFGISGEEQFETLGGNEELLNQKLVDGWAERKRAFSLGESRDGKAWLLISLEKKTLQPALFYLSVTHIPEDFALASLRVLIAQAEIALDNVRLFQEVQELATKDELTGLSNRRHIFQCAHEEVDRARRFKHPLSVVMVDVDHFKSLNDTHGHQAGDQVLKVVANRLFAGLRKIDRAGRYGGEEFMLLLPGCNENDAIKVVAERLRQAICESSIPSSHGDLTVTASFGVAEFRCGEETFEEALAGADQSLYAAKERGRNCCVARSELSDVLKNVS